MSGLDLSNIVSKYDVQTVVLTGAGASAPLGLKLMDSFLDLLEERATQEEENILRNIYDQYPLDSGLPGRDLEVVLEKLNLYKTYFDLNEVDRNWATVGKGGNFDTYKQQIFNLDTKIKNLIFEHYSTINPVAVENLFKPLCDVLKKRGRFAFFTTNYDVAIEAFSRVTQAPLIDGFIRHHDGKTRWESYILSQPWDGRPDAIALYKLHGSIDWYRDDSGNLKGDMVKHTGLSLTTLTDHQNMIIYPSQTKTGLIEGAPFSTLYEHLGAYVRHVRWLIIIGHSLRDEKLLETIKNAIMLNPNLECIVVKKNIDNNYQKLLKQLGVKKIHLVKAHFESGKNQAYLKEITRIFKPQVHNI